MQVVVVFASSEQQEEIALHLGEGATVGDALRESGMLTRHPDLMDATVGVWGRTVARDAVLRDGDRVEMYRPLQADPKESRRRRAAHRLHRRG